MTVKDWVTRVIYILWAFLGLSDKNNTTDHFKKREKKIFSLCWSDSLLLACLHKRVHIWGNYETQWEFSVVNELKELLNEQNRIEPDFKNTAKFRTHPRHSKTKRVLRKTWRDPVSNLRACPARCFSVGHLVAIFTLAQLLFNCNINQMSKILF